MTHDPLGSIEMVIVSKRFRDPALDAESMQLDEYVKTRDPALIRDREGMTATRFFCEPLKRTWVAETVDSFEAESKRYGLAFLAACTAVRLGDGTVLKPETRYEGPYKQLVAGPEWHERIADQFGMVTIYEIGKLAWERAQLPAGARGPFGL